MSEPIEVCCSVEFYSSYIHLDMDQTLQCLNLIFNHQKNLGMEARAFIDFAEMPKFVPESRELRFKMHNVYIYSIREVQYAHLCGLLFFDFALNRVNAASLFSYTKDRPRESRLAAAMNFVVARLPTSSSGWLPQLEHLENIRDVVSGMSIPVSVR